MPAINLDYAEGLYFILEDMTWLRSEDKLTQFHEACHQFLHISNHGSLCENSMTVQESFANIYPYHFWHNELVKKGLIKDKERIDFVLDGVRKDVLTGSKLPFN